MQPLNIPGTTPLTPLEMNDIHFSKLHTLLTEQILKSLKTSASASV